MKNKEKKYNEVRNCVVVWYLVVTLWAIAIIVAKLPHSQWLAVGVVAILPIVLVLLGLAYAR